ncbi:glycosyltransferase family 9 protein [Streptomyces zagrosensis]|uniref:ADP-heptose:LPS heptosyltransferase n=1 Tax=Streptomyces zagrosensis TaxID=1042984 RepID=A0A7W9V0E1_9ACTN|nr:glycosyltransferase family 9 protein [Streptomyces zagrosensis]MBB5937171.1 ADP-heptose:LPS heptosyltransferase [Streptomyces zagrosensis]
MTGPGDRDRVLVLRALGFGDLLTAIPALRALRRGLPDHDLVLAAPARLADAATATGLVDHLLPTTAAGRAVPCRLDWSGPPPDVAVDLHGNGPPSHLLLDRLRPGRLLAYAHPQTPHLRGPEWRPDEHERHRWCRLLAWYGFPADPDDLSLPAPSIPSPAAGAVVVHPGADAAARRWPPDRFAAVARALCADGHRVVITAGAGEAPLAAEVAARAGLAPDAVFGGAADVPFDHLAALVAAAHAVVVGDTGLAHLATALGTPSVVLFGPVAPRLWGPPRSPRHRALWHPDLPGGAPGSTDPARPGDAHGERPDERLLRINSDEVIDAVRALSRASGPHRPLVPQAAP